MTVDANVNAMYQKGNNRTTSGGYYMNPLVGLYHFPRGGVEGGKDFNYYKDNYQVLNTGRILWIKTGIRLPEPIWSKILIGLSTKCLMKIRGTVL